MNRRILLTGTGSTITAIFAGCFSRSDSWEEGNIIVRNQTQTSLTGSILISKFSNNHNDADQYLNRTEPPIEPIWQRERKFDVLVNNTEVYSDLISEPGTYHLTVECERGETEFYEVGLHPAGRDGELPGGGYIVIELSTIDERPSIAISKGRSD